jgi:hypothetical protein
VTTWAILLAYWALLPFSIGGLVLLRRRRVPIFPFLAVIGATVVTVAMSFGITRYRAGVDVLIPVLAAVGIAALWRYLRRPPTDEALEAAPDDEFEPSETPS